ncbi:MAG: flagellar hook-associated protein FlgK [Pseudomonadota bacterium]
MPDLLGTSLTGMLAFQRALQLTSHNIANANTPGYSRQVAEFTSRIGGGSGQNYVGGGTQIASIKRMYDSLLVNQLQTAQTGLARFGALNSLSSRMDTLLADADTGLSASMQNFFNAVQDVANDPSNTTIRQAMLGEADGIAARFRTLDQQLNTQEKEVSDRLRLAVDDINRISGQIAEVNDLIAREGVGAQPNDLLDRRDQLVLELSGLIAVSTAEQDDGTLSVFIGSGRSLVIGIDAQRLGIRGDEFDPTRATIVYEGAGATAPLDASLSGGVVGGLLEFRTRMLDPARQTLGQTAAALALQFNTQHQSGLDLRGNLGGDFFGIDPPQILYSSGNTGSPSAVAQVADLGAYTGANYVLEFDGAGYTLTREDSGEVIPMTGTGTAGDPFVADGITIEVGGSPAAGDRMLIRTGHGAAASMQTLIDDPRSVALASPTRSSASLGNIGDATISTPITVDADDPGLLTSAVIEFTSATTYTINGGATVYTYTDGDPILINGNEVTINGSPTAGDQFTIEANLGASGDNGNGLLLANLQSLGLLENGAISINESYGQLIAGVGATAYQIQEGFEAQDVVFRNAEDAVLSKSAVNLDEEAANLVRFQQAYQASAQVVNVTKQLFDSLLAATSR